MPVHRSAALERQARQQREFWAGHRAIDEEMEATSASEIQLRERPCTPASTVADLEQLLAMERAAVRPGSRAVARRRDDDDVDDDLSLLDDDENPAAPDSLLADEVKQMYVERFTKDLNVDTSVGLVFVQDAVEVLGQLWRLDKIIARLLLLPTRRNLDEARKIGLMREVVHRALARDIDVLRLLRLPVSGVQVQVAAEASNGCQVNVAVAPVQGPIPKRRR